MARKLWKDPPCWMDTQTISIAIFNSKLLNYPRVSDWLAYCPFNGKHADWFSETSASQCKYIPLTSYDKVDAVHYFYNHSESWGTRGGLWLSKSTMRLWGLKWLICSILYTTCILYPLEKQTYWTSPLFTSKQLQRCDFFQSYWTHYQRVYSS